MIRVSGADALPLVRRALAEGELPAERGARRVVLHDGRGPVPALALVMPGPRSYTREDTVELHLPGAPGLCARALARLLELGAAQAGPGEFTRRAFESGRIDLTRAEGVLELVSAAGEAERRAAAHLLAGGLARRVDALREGLVELRALCEASLDFDESDTGHVPEEELVALFERARRGLAETAEWERARAPERGLPRIVLAGAPNAGKSSLFNALAGEERALVADLAGTTRDGLEGELLVGGAPCALLDAPGFARAARCGHGAHGALGGAAAARAEELAARARGAADLFLWVVDGARADAEDALAELELLPPGAPRVLVWSKADRADARPEPPPALRAAVPLWTAASAATGAGLEDVRRLAARALGLGPEPGGGGGGVSRELQARHRAALDAASTELARARAARDDGLPLDLVAEHLRDATRALDEIGGATTPEHVLDRVFARFCIGK